MSSKADKPIEVEAEVIEDKGLTVSFTPAAIDANFDALDARVEELIAGYAEARYDLTDSDEIKQAKRDRTYLNGIAKEIDERRKAVKREYMRPLDDFEARANAITAKVKKASANIKEQLDEAEERRKDRAYAILKEYYEDLAGMLAPVVPYERIHDEKWLNKTFGEMKAKAAIDEKVAKVATDWETLQAQRETLPRYEVAEREFFASLDLGAALNAAREAQEADERIAGMRAEMAEYGSCETPTDTEPETAPEPVPEPEPAPQAAPVPQVAPAPQVATAPQAAAPVAVPGGRYVPCVMVIQAASIEQMQQIGRFCGSLSPRVTGKFVTGTLEEAYMKECAQTVAAAAAREGTVANG